jgi:hypothetical protein
VKLVGAVSQGSGAHNEDGFGFVEQGGRVTAAWVFDGVTSVNAEPLLAVASEPQWFVTRAERHMQEAAQGEGDVLQILHELTRRLMRDWAKATGGIDIPAGYDLPAACLTLVKRVNGRWQGLRLGDSYILSMETSLTNHPFPPSDLPDLEADLIEAAANRRSQGVFDMNALRREFRPRMLRNRGNRNASGSYSILVPDQSALNMPQIIDLGTPTEILLCTDGFYRAVDTYGLFEDANLFSACKSPGGIESVVTQIRAIESTDPTCEHFPRFKPADDVTALMLAM